MQPTKPVLTKKGLWGGEVGCVTGLCLHLPGNESHQKSRFPGPEQHLVQSSLHMSPGLWPRTCAPSCLPPLLPRTTPPSVSQPGSSSPMVCLPSTFLPTSLSDQDFQWPQGSLTNAPHKHLASLWQIPSPPPTPLPPPPPMLDTQRCSFSFTPKGASNKYF